MIQVNAKLGLGRSSAIRKEGEYAVTKGEMLYLGLVIVTFGSFAIMLAYHDIQYRMSRIGHRRQASADRHAEGAIGSLG